MFASRVKFPTFIFTIAMVWNNSTTLFACITYATISSINFGVLIYVVGFLNPCTNDPISCTILSPNSNSNGNPSADYGLLGGTCIFDGLNTSKEGCVSTLSICNSVACRFSYVYCCCCCKCCGLAMVSIQSSYTFPSKCRCSPTFGNLMSCSSLTSYFYSLNCFSCGHAICGTSFLYSLNYVSYGVVICGTSIVYMAACTIVGTTECSIFPLIIFYALTFVLSCSVFTPLCKVLPSSTLFFLLRTLLGKYVVAFFLFSNVVYISSLVLLTLVGGYVDSPFDAQMNIERFLPILR